MHQRVFAGHKYHNCTREPPSHGTVVRLLRQRGKSRISLPVVQPLVHAVPRIILLNSPDGFVYYTKAATRLVHRRMAPSVHAVLPVGGPMSQHYDTLRITPTDDGYVVMVEMHRPEALNAMNTAMGRELLACFEGFFWDTQTRVVILTGAGDRAFCVGGDLKERQGMSDEAWREQHVIFEQAAFRLLRCPLPVIAAVEGFAMGGGCELAVLSDFVVAGETAVFAVPEVTRGIFPGIGGTQLLPRIVGAPFAKEMIFTGRRVPAEEAKAVGFVNHLVPAGQARAKALEIATTIAQNGPIAVRQAKKAIAWGTETDLETGMRLAIEAYNSTVHTDDRLEGVRAFNERRPPRFQGR